MNNIIQHMFTSPDDGVPQETFCYGVRPMVTVDQAASPYRTWGGLAAGFVPQEHMTVKLEMKCARTFQAAFDLISQGPVDIIVRRSRGGTNE